MTRAFFRFSDFLDEIWSMYDEQDAMGQGVSTGWSGLDSYYRVCPNCHSVLFRLMKGVYKNEKMLSGTVAAGDI